MTGIYEKMSVLEDLKEIIEDVLNTNIPSTNTIINRFTISFYEDEEDEKVKKSVGITFEPSVDTDIVPYLKIFEEIKKKTGCSDIFLDVSTDDYVESFELFFEEERK